MSLLEPTDIVDPSTGLTAWDLMLRPCRTREELRNWLITFLGIDLPDSIVDPASTCTPLDMAWMVYSNCLWWNQLPPEQRHRKMLFYASRFGFKTLAMAAIEFMVAIHDHRGIVHTASVLEQAQKCYQDYFQSFLNLPFFSQIRQGLKESTMRRCKLADGTKIICIPVTKRAVQGQHESLLCRDEVDVVQDVRAYDDLDGIPIGMPDKRPAIDVAISVRKTAFGLVQREIEAAERDEKQIHIGHWNVIDVTERCPDERSGTTPVDLYIREGTMHYVDQAGYDKLDPGEKFRYQATPGLEGCFTRCKLFAACQTNLKRQASTSTWLKPIDDIEAQLLKTEDTMFIASFLSRKPPSEGLVYTRFDQKNIKTYKEMYKVFSGEDWPKETMSLDDFIGVMKKHKVPAVAGVDWGFTNPSVCVVAYIDRNDNIYIVYCLSRRGVDDGEFVRMIAEEIHPRFDIQRYFPDTENPSNIKLMISTYDLPVSKSVDKTKGSVYNGVQVVKRFITAPGTNKAKLFVTTENGCSFVIYEFGKYHHETDAQGRIDDTKFAALDNHSMDCIRYIAYTVYGRSTVTMTVATAEDGRPKDQAGRPIEELPAKDLNGNFTRVPSAADLAAHLGISGFHDNREEIAKRNNPDADDDKAGGPGGGFSWSF